MTEFIRREAWGAQQRGYNNTTLFSYPGESDVIAFITAAAAMLELSDGVGEALGFRGRYAPRRDQVPAVVIPWFGVAEVHQGNTLGFEVHTQLLENIRDSMAASRFIWLEVWEGSPALEFYEDAGYIQIGTSSDIAPDGHARSLLKLALDRAAVPNT